MLMNGFVFCFSFGNNNVLLGNLELKAYPLIKLVVFG